MSVPSFHHHRCNNHPNTHHDSGKCQYPLTCCSMNSSRVVLILGRVVGHVIFVCVCHYKSSQNNQQSMLFVLISTSRGLLIKLFNSFVHSGASSKLSGLNGSLPIGLAGNGLVGKGQTGFICCAPQALRLRLCMRL
jgi:hypothetical protein